MTDSQGRDLSSHLAKANSGMYNIFNHWHPGAPLEPIISSITNSTNFNVLSKKNDCVVLVGGTNYVREENINNSNSFLGSLEEYMDNQQELFKHTNVILCTIPYRYDLNCDCAETRLSNKECYILNFPC